MSGIAGAVADDGSALEPGLAVRLADAAGVRGRDGRSVWQEGPACLIRHHHATTPQAVGETQPLWAPGNRRVLVFDGRLDNRDELVALAPPPGRADGVSDAVILLALFERFGERSVEHLVGDWAFAVWTRSERSLFLARSVMGWRPLLWSHAGGVFGFSTEPRTLIEGLRLDRRVDEGAAGEFLSLRPTTRTATLWRSVRQIEPGGALRVERGRIREWRWHGVPPPIDERLSDADHVDRFDALFGDAVAAACRSNTPVSAHLSGGLDSSSVVTRAVGLHRAGRITQPIQAISARFPGRPYDETRWSHAVEERLGIEAQVTSATRYSFEAARRWVADSYYLPLRPAFVETGLPGIRLIAAQNGRVLLTGEGGDDWMANSVAYFADLLRAGRLPTLLRAGLEQNPEYPLLRRLLRTAFWSVAPHVSRDHRQRIAVPFYHTRALSGWIDRDWARRIGLENRFRNAAPGAFLPSLTQQYRHANYDHPGRMALYGASAAYAQRHGIELRHPFHDLRLTRFLMTAAPRMMQEGAVRKRLLREAMRGELAETVRTRRDKTTLSPAMTAAITGRLAERPVDAMQPVALGWLDRGAVRAMAEAACRPGADPPFAVLSPLWNIIALDLWMSEIVGT